jgi:hypothetical protein
MIYKSDGYTASQLDNYLRTKSPNSPLNGKGSAFIAAGKKYGVNPGFMLGIANSESSLGLQCLPGGGSVPAPGGLEGSRNAFGLTTHGQGSFITFSSFEEGIDRAAKNIASPLYKGLNGSIHEFRLKWCGFEREIPAEAGHLPVILSDGSKIKDACENKQSKWEDEIMAIMNAIK